ncbi:hypothetical protein EU537_00605 [Candidatus Thorarchaeota archaeon]|nr:MAG: hypothetical protein EU537_00605 [Candidatus Thorarchaeota archaeon]
MVCLDMLLERLQSKTNSVWIGIEHIVNESELSRSDLLGLLNQQPKMMAAQFLNHQFIAGSDHLLSAAQNALNAWEGGYAVSRSLSVEIILFASGQRQISRALDTLGIEKLPENMLIVVVGIKKPDIEQYIGNLVATIGEPQEPMFRISDRRIQQISDYFDVSRREILAISETESIEDRWKALSKCVASRVSMVAFDL